MSLIQKRRSWVVLGAAALAVTAVGPVACPLGTAAMRFEKPITIVVTFPPGGRGL